jgi:hypothetical protein
MMLTYGNINKKWQLPVRDELVFHPDDLACVPSQFVLEAQRCGILVTSNHFMVRGMIVGMGRAAEIIRSMKFHQDVQNAMRENQAFLELLKRSNLLEDV